MDNDVGYGLLYNPFAPSCRSLKNRFLSEDFKQALARAKRTVQQAGIYLLMGNPGTGLSFATGCAADDLNAGRATVKYMTANQVSVRDTLKQICRTVGADPAGKTRQVLINAIAEKAISLKEQQRPLFLIVDNAQNLPQEILEDIPFLAAGDYPAVTRMGVMLSGSRDMKERVQQIPSLRLRVSDFYTLSGLKEEEAGPYVLHMLRAAGAAQNILDEEATRLLYTYSASGNYRILNNVMRDALYLGQQLKQPMIDKKILLSSATHQF